MLTWRHRALSRRRRRPRSRNQQHSAQKNGVTMLLTVTRLIATWEALTARIAVPPSAAARPQASRTRP
jgi:hypothetical protein